MSPSNELKSKLKHCEIEVRLYVTELEFENAKLQVKIAKLEVKEMTAKNTILALKKHLKKNQIHDVKTLEVSFVKP